MDFSADFYRNLLDSISDGVYFLDADRRITFWNRGAEELTGYSGDEVIGCFCREDVLEHTDELGNRLCDVDLCPSVKALTDGEEREEILFLRHKKGYRIPMLTKIFPLREVPRGAKGVVVTFSNASQLLGYIQTISELRKLSLMDPLTGIGNRRFAEMNLHLRLKELERYGWSFGVLFIDLDDFKVINDLYGHETGDELLRVVATTLRSSLRVFDMVSRWGGEEFLVLVTNVDAENLKRVGEKIRLLVEQSWFSARGDRIRATVSVGGILAGVSDTPEKLVARADANMYRAKAEGKNRVVIA
ncbi:diguanylate cyclase [Candidatus Solincola tengchongensis]|uniref:sensor domain-containing diguanylate cyclase n=1 Tax=Candidatus Solincola tengchongensis TaxID=2900693 RepID=UPI002580A015|nr:diguanylate cyclase [Candidatus Solincola tengchongensis]